MAQGGEISAAADWLEVNLQIVREITRQFLDSGQWPTRNQIGRWGLRQNREQDVYSALDSMPKPAGFVDGSDGRVKLRVRSLASVAEAEEVVEHFLGAVSLACSRLSGNDLNPKIAAADLIESLGLSESMARRVGVVLLGEGWMLGGGSGGEDDAWEREVTERARFVLDVATIPAYLAIEAERAGAGRVAVLLVAGVGDEKEGTISRKTRDALAGLSNAGGGPRYESSGEAPFPVSVPGAGVFNAHRKSMVRHVDGEGVGIDLIEMRWADISRFDDKLLTFFATLFGLALQLLTLSLEALRPASSAPERQSSAKYWLGSGFVAALVGVLTGFAISGATGAAFRAGYLGFVVALVGMLCASGFSRRSLRGAAHAAVDASSWWLATIVVPSTVAAAAGGTSLWLAVDKPLGIHPVIGLVAPILLAAVALVPLGKGIADGGWRYGQGAWEKALNPRWLSFVPLLVLGGVLLANLSLRSSVAIAGRGALVSSGYVLRAAWLVALTLIAAALLLTCAFRIFAGGSGKRWLTAMIGLVGGPLLAAVVGLLLIGGIGTFAFKSADDARWGKDLADVRCLETAASWSWSNDCGKGSADLATIVQHDLDRVKSLERCATEIEQSTTPQACALPGLSPHHSAYRTALEARAAATAITHQAGEREREMNITPTFWAQHLLGQVGAPLAVALLGLMGILLFLLVIGLSDEWRPGYVISRVLAGTQTSNKEKWGALVAGVFALGSLAVTAIAIGWWLSPAVQQTAADLIPGRFSKTATAGIVSALALILLTVVRFVPYDPRKWRDDVSGAFKTLKGYVDRAYDVATYLRIDNGDGVRSRVVKRFRAVIQEVDRQGYTAVVIVAHSQGAVYAVSTLCGDCHRKEQNEGGWAIAPLDMKLPGLGLILTKAIRLVTFGNPLNQLYEARFPEEYRWPIDRGYRVSRVLRQWYNLYLPRDVLGRSVFHTATDVQFLVQKGYWPWPPAVNHPSDVCLDVCLGGAGGHTSYWGNSEMTKWLDYAIGSAAGQSALVPPGDYTMNPPQ